MLLTRLPLSGKSKSNFVQVLSYQWATSFDLHVLGMPPAFILSQDQTLQKNKLFLNLNCLFLTISELTFCSVFKDHSCSPFWRANPVYQIKKIMSIPFFKKYLIFLIWHICLRNALRINFFFAQRDTNITPLVFKVNTFFAFFSKTLN